LGRGPEGALTTRWYAFPNEVELPVIGALVRDATTGYLALGMGCHPRPESAMEKALGEAFQLQLLLTDYDDPRGGFAHAAMNPTSPLKPWRPNRDYTNAYRTDLRDAVEFGCHLQLHLDPTMQAAFEAQLATASATEVQNDWNPPRDLAETGQRLVRGGHRAISVDVTTDDVRAAGLHVVRVVVPGYYSISAAGLPFLGGIRLPRVLAGRTPCLLPLPH
jgi:ribosomal protein S12 methylthiotransferase accessory factor